MPSLPIPAVFALVLGFCCLRLWQAQGRLTALGLLLGMCAVQSLVIALAQHYGVPGMPWVQPVTASLIPPLAWLACLTTSVRDARSSDLLHGLGPLLTLAALGVAPAFIDVLLPGAFAGYGIAILVHALGGADAQPRALLSHGNLPARIWLVVGGALLASALSDGLIVLAQVMGHGDLRLWIITVFSAGNLMLIGLVGLSPHLRGDARDQPDPPVRPAGPDADLWLRVATLMERERPYLDPNLTLARLARTLRVPAKSLSTTINRATGGNVSRYVNNARIGHAQAALLRGESVTEAMLSSGFNTKSNFNREFLRVAGASPSDWLRTARATPGNPR